jgi:hypothetical protein
MRYWPLCGTRILRVIHGRDARATFKLTTTPVPLPRLEACGPLRRVSVPRS